LDVVTVLVVAGANILADSSRAITWATAQGHTDVVTYLLAHLL
jgi:hypothetical protein